MLSCCWIWESAELRCAIKCWPRQVFLGISYQNVTFLNKLCSVRFYAQEKRDGISYFLFK